MTSDNDNSDVTTYFNRRAGTLLQEPGEQDVLLKRPAGHHKGNQRLLEDTEEFRERFKLASTLSEKKEMAHQILLRVKERGGLFLMYTPPQTSNSATDEACWCIQNYEESSLRVRQILREATGGKTKGTAANHLSNHASGAVKNTATLPGSMLTPRIPRGNHLSQQHPNYSSEYLEACKVLSDDTMNQACELLLNTTRNPQDAKEQLLQIYQKCVQAASVIETELQNNPTTATFPLPPVLRGRAGSLGMASTANNSTAPKIKTVIPPVNRTQRMTHPSDYPHRGSMGSTNSNGAKGLPPSKKMRLAPSPPPAAPSTSEVPESALQFLAKLNNEQHANHNDDSEDKKKTKKNSSEESDSQSTKNSEDMEQEKSLEAKQETSLPAVRVQPKRGSKAN